MEAAQFRERLDIAVTPKMQFEYYKYMRAKYNSMIHPEGQKIPERPSAMVLDAASNDTREVMLGAFRSLKRGLGYGG